MTDDPTAGAVTLPSSSHDAFPGCSECPGGDYDATSNPTGTGPCTAGAPAVSR